MSKISQWNEDKIQELKNLYLTSDLSSVEIAKRLGLTKNAVIGKIHRMGLNIEKANIGKDSVDIVEQLGIVSEKIVNPTYKKGDCLLEHLEYSMCAWPYGDDHITFCGEPVIFGNPYCQEHLKLVYLPVKKALIKRENIYIEDKDEEVYAEDLDDIEIEEDIIE